MKKFFLYIFISIILAGIFSPVFNVQADGANPSEPCRFNQGDNGNNPTTATNYPCEQYVLLSPFSTSLVNVDTAGPNALEKYLNLMIKIIIGLSAVLAMVMIFMGGIEYMTSEVISNKEHGKERIRNALFGLLLALGSYVLLNTINPDLLKTSLNIEGVTITIEDEVELAPTEIGFSSSPPSGVVNTCTAGVVSIGTPGGNFIVCNTIGGNLQAMIRDAWAQSPQIKISGFGLRTREGQIQRRRATCGVPVTNFTVYEKPADQCDPPTARPGNSRHESGLAVDLKCDGIFLPRTNPTSNPCFVWLRTNAERYGFYNLASEPWHWSIDGK